MKTIILLLIFSLSLGLLKLQAQTSPSSPTKPEVPTDQDQKEEGMVDEGKDLVFPPDLVDTLSTDTSEIKGANIDSSGALKNEKTESMEADRMRKEKPKSLNHSKTDKQNQSQRSKQNKKKNN